MNKTLFQHFVHISIIFISLTGHFVTLTILYVHRCQWAHTELHDNNTWY